MDALYENCMTSKHYPMFCKLGYPQLDVQLYDDCSWSIIEFENAPLVPSLTKWRVIFSGFENVEFNESFVKKMIQMIDLEREETWERLKAEEEERQANDDGIANRRLDAVLEASSALSKNDALMERAAAEGPSAFSLDSLLKTMSPHQIRSTLGARVQVFA